jgi:hypothetical protein
MIMHISDATLSRINQAIGFKLVTKAGTSGLINLSRVVPLAGGLVGGGFDAAVTRGIGAAAKRTFIPVAADDVFTTEVTLMLPSGNDRVMEVPFNGA